MTVMRFSTRVCVCVCVCVCILARVIRSLHLETECEVCVRVCVSVLERGKGMNECVRV